MAKHILFLILLIFISDAYTLNLKAKNKLKNTASLHDPSNGCTISLRKMKDDKTQAISFISEMQNSLNHYSKCKNFFM